MSLDVLEDSAIDVSVDEADDFEEGYSSWAKWALALFVLSTVGGLLLKSLDQKDLEDLKAKLKAHGYDSLTADQQIALATNVIRSCDRIFPPQLNGANTECYSSFHTGREIAPENLQFRFGVHKDYYQSGDPLNQTQDNWVFSFEIEKAKLAAPSISADDIQNVVVQKGDPYRGWDMKDGYQSNLHALQTLGRDLAQLTGKRRKPKADLIGLQP